MNLCLTGALILGLLTAAEKSKVNKSNFLKIRNGMSQRDVEAILGKPDDCALLVKFGALQPENEVDIVTGIPVFRSSATWVFGDTEIRIFLDKNDEVAESRFVVRKKTPAESSGQKWPAAKPHR